MAPTTSIVSFLAFFVVLIHAASLVEVTSFGNNPGSVRMHIYVPDNVLSNPGIIVAMHGCGGSGPSFYSSTRFASLASSLRNFLVIYPSATRDSNCFDAHTAASLSHNGGSDSLSIANMVSYALGTYSGDSSRVFATGSSSGGIMTNVLMGAYPDVFAAGSAFSGMPYACEFGNTGSAPSTANQTCAQGGIQKTGAQWAQFVHNGYPGYTGPYPRMQTWHGTADTLIRYQSLIEQVKEWSTVQGVAFTRNDTNTPLSGYTKMVFGDGTKFVAYSAQGVGHVVPTREDDVLAWFGLTGTSATTTGATSSTTLQTSTSSRTSSAAAGTTTGTTGCASAKYAQCGGTGWTGCKSCVSGSTCTYSNAYYSQCL